MKVPDLLATLVTANREVELHVGRSPGYPVACNGCRTSGPCVRAASVMWWRILRWFAQYDVQNISYKDHSVLPCACKWLQDIPSMREGGKRYVVASPGPMQRQGTKSLLWVVGLSQALEEAGGKDSRGCAVLRHDSWYACCPSITTCTDP
jgi:hypothetical protein